MRTRYDIKEDWGAWKKGQYVMLLTEPLELIEMGVLEDAGVKFNIPKHASIESVTYDDKEYEVGDMVEFTITVKTGCKEIKEVKFNNVDVSGDLTEVTAGEVYTLELTITQLNNVLNVEAYEIASFTITKDETINSVTYPTQDYLVGADNVIFTITLDAPNNGLKEATFNGVDVIGDITEITPNSVYSLEVPVTQASNELVVRAGETVEIAVNEDENRSTTTYDNSKQYFVGDEVEFTIGFKSGYELDTIMWNVTDVTEQFANDKITLICVTGINMLSINANII